MIRVGDTHNFGRRVEVGDTWVEKPRTVFWEWLLLAAESPLRRALAELEPRPFVSGPFFSFLPALEFVSPFSLTGGKVSRASLSALDSKSFSGSKARDARLELAHIAGRAMALFAWFGVADLHWENMILGRGDEGQLVFAPVDVEILFADMDSPVQTKLIADPDPEYAELSQHAAGFRRLLPYLGKPVEGPTIAAMVAGYAQTYALLQAHRSKLAEAVLLPQFALQPIRVCLRATAEYIDPERRPWPPWLAAEIEQLKRGDIPYFFQLYGEGRLRWFTSRALDASSALPSRGDVPRAPALLDIRRDFRGKNRESLLTRGLFAIVGALDHPDLRGTFEAFDASLRLGARKVVIAVHGEELEATRSLESVVSSLYMPCRCGEVQTVFVPPKTRCRE
jgi:hypothetical protein